MENNIIKMPRLGATTPCPLNADNFTKTADFPREGSWWQRTFMMISLNRLD